MRHLKQLLPQCLLALALMAHHAAQAAPIYHVSVDTTGNIGTGLMDFTFLANDGATSATAVLSNFGGSFGTTFDRSPGAGGAIPGGVVLGNQNFGDYLTQYVNLGGLFSFDISFEGDFATTDNVNESLFNATLYNADMTGYIGGAGSFAQFVLVPQAGGNPGGVLASSPTGQASVTRVAEVPEPSSSLLALGALGVVGLVRRKRAPGRRSAHALASGTI